MELEITHYKPVEFLCVGQTGAFEPEKPTYGARLGSHKGYNDVLIFDDYWAHSFGFHKDSFSTMILAILKEIRVHSRRDIERNPGVISVVLSYWNYSTAASQKVAFIESVGHTATIGWYGKQR